MKASTEADAMRRILAHESRLGRKRPPSGLERFSDEAIAAEHKHRKLLRKRLRKVSYNYNGDPVYLE